MECLRRLDLAFLHREHIPGHMLLRIVRSMAAHWHFITARSQIYWEGFSEEVGVDVMLIIHGLLDGK